MGRSRIGILAVVRPDAGHVDGECFEKSLREIDLKVVLPAVLAQVHGALAVVGPNRDEQEARCGKVASMRRLVDQPGTHGYGRIRNPGRASGRIAADPPVGQGAERHDQIQHERKAERLVVVEVASDADVAVEMAVLHCTRDRVAQLAVGGELIVAHQDAVARPTSRSKLKSEGVLPVMSREPRLKVRSWIAHFRKTTTRLWNWTRYMMWMSDQMSHAGSPARWTPNTFATAEALPITAMVPLSKYLNGGRGFFPRSRRAITLPAYVPCCIATWATP